MMQIRSGTQWYSVGLASCPAMHWSYAGECLELTGKAGLAPASTVDPLAVLLLDHRETPGTRRSKHKKKKKRHKEAKAAAGPELEISPESMTGQEASVEDDGRRRKRRRRRRNGRTMTVRLHHNDRVVIGTNCVLRVVIPERATRIASPMMTAS